MPPVEAERVAESASILSNPMRVMFLEALEHNDRQAEMGVLAEYIAAETGMTFDTVVGTLEHQHLPKMVEAQCIQRDGDIIKAYTDVEGMEETIYDDCVAIMRTVGDE